VVRKAAKWVAESLDGKREVGSGKRNATED